MPALHVPSRADLCILQQRYGAQLSSYPTAFPQPTAVCFDLFTVKPKEMEEAVLSWQKTSFSDYLVLNKTQLTEDSAAAVMTNLDSWNSSACYKEPKNSYEKQLSMYKHPKEEQD